MKKAFKGIMVLIILNFVWTGTVQAETYSGGTTSTMPGKIIIWTSNTIPSGYLLCNGQAVSRTTYANLYNVIGTTYGTGNGSTTFNVPNMMDKTTIGTSSTNGLASTGGLTSVTLTTANIPSHTHSIPALSGTAANAGAHQHYIDPSNTSARTMTFGNQNNNVSNRWALYTGLEGFSTVVNAGWYNNWNKGRLQQVASAGAHTHSVTTTASTAGNTGSGGSFNVQNPYIIENYIIKY